MDNLTKLISVPVITAICYGVIEIYKYATNSNEKFVRFIPVIAAALGIALGVISFYCAKNIIAADNVLVAMLIGLSSGLAATGTHQIFKQLTISGISNAAGQAEDAAQTAQTAQTAQAENAAQGQETENKEK